MKKKEPQTVIYCGPPIRNNPMKPLVRYVGLPDGYKEACAITPLVQSMVIPASDFLRMRSALKKPTSVESVVYAKIAQIVKGE